MFRRISGTIRWALNSSSAALALRCAASAFSVSARPSVSAALDLAYVAAGRYDGFWEQGLSPWDMAAGIVIVREAGGLISDLSGGDAMLESGDILATNDRLHGPPGRILRYAGVPGRQA